MRSPRLALAAGLVASIIAASPVSATARYSSASCTISSGNTVTSVVLKGLDWDAGAPYVWGSDTRSAFSISTKNAMNAGGSGSYSYTYSGTVYKYVLFTHTAGGTTKSKILGCR